MVKHWVAPTTKHDPRWSYDNHICNVLLRRIVVVELYTTVAAELQTSCDMINSETNRRDTADGQIHSLPTLIDGS